jgi:type II secretory pathway component GspD/PulD (secretin)
VTLGPAALLAAAILATAWAQARALPEGDAPMRTPWKRSLAALVLVAALGSDTKPALSSDSQPPAGGGQPAPADRAAGADEKTRQLEKTQQDVQKALQYLGRQKADLEKQQEAIQRGTADDRAVDKLNAELEKLQQQAAALEEKRAELEAQIKALRDKQEAAAGPRIKIFRLKYRDAKEMANVLTRFLQSAPPAAAMGMGPMGPGGPGMASGMMPGGKGGGMMGPGGMGGMMGGGMPAGRTWSVAADQRANCVIVRGTEHDLQLAADLVATLDVAEDKPAPQAKNLRVIRLRFADANEVAQVLDQLHVEANVVSAPKAHAVIVSGPPAALKEVSEVIEALDVEGKPETGKEQPRGGTRPPGPGSNNPGGGN